MWKGHLSLYVVGLKITNLPLFMMQLIEPGTCKMLFVREDSLLSLPFPKGAKKSNLIKRKGSGNQSWTRIPGRSRGRRSSALTVRSLGHQGTKVWGRPKWERPTILRCTQRVTVMMKIRSQYRSRHKDQDIRYLGVRLHRLGPKCLLLHLCQDSPGIILLESEEFWQGTR